MVAQSVHPPRGRRRRSGNSCMNSDISNSNSSADRWGETPATVPPSPLFPPYCDAHCDDGDDDEQDVAAAAAAAGAPADQGLQRAGLSAWSPCFGGKFLPLVSSAFAAMFDSSPSQPFLTTAAASSSSLSSSFSPRESATSWLPDVDADEVDADGRSCGCWNQAKLVCPGAVDPIDANYCGAAGGDNIDLTQLLPHLQNGRQTTHPRFAVAQATMKGRNTGDGDDNLTDYQQQQEKEHDQSAAAALTTCNGTPRSQLETLFREQQERLFREQQKHEDEEPEGRPTCDDETWNGPSSVASSSSSSLGRRRQPPRQRVFDLYETHSTRLVPQSRFVQDKQQQQLPQLPPATAAGTTAQLDDDDAAVEDDNDGEVAVVAHRDDWRRRRRRRRDRKHIMAGPRTPHERSCVPFRKCSKPDCVCVTSASCRGGSKPQDTTIQRQNAILEQQQQHPLLVQGSSSSWQKPLYPKKNDADHPHHQSPPYWCTATTEVTEATTACTLLSTMDNYVLHPTTTDVASFGEGTRDGIRPDTEGTSAAATVATAAAVGTATTPAGANGRATAAAVTVDPCDNIDAGCEQDLVGLWIDQAQQKMPPQPPSIEHRLLIGDDEPSSEHRPRRGDDEGIVCSSVAKTPVQLASAPPQLLTAADSLLVSSGPPPKKYSGLHRHYDHLPQKPLGNSQRQPCRLSFPDRQEGTIIHNDVCRRHQSVPGTTSTSEPPRKPRCRSEDVVIDGNIIQRVPTAATSLTSATVAAGSNHHNDFQLDEKSGLPSTTMGGRGRGTLKFRQARSPTSVVQTQTASSGIVDDPTIPPTQRHDNNPHLPKTRPNRMPPASCHNRATLALETALDGYRKAIPLIKNRRQQCRRHPGGECAPERGRDLDMIDVALQLANVYHNMGLLHYQLCRYTTTMHVLQHAVEVLTQTGRDPSRPRLVLALSEAIPFLSSRALLLVAELFTTQAKVQLAQGRPEQAKVDLQHVFEWCSRGAQQEQTDVARRTTADAATWTLARSRAQVLLAQVSQREHRPDVAMRLLQEAVGVQRQILGGDHVLVADSVHQIGNLHLAHGFLDLAARCYHEALRVYQWHSNNDRSMTDASLTQVVADGAATLAGLGWIHLLRHDYRSALQATNQALQWTLQTVGPMHRNVASLQYQLGWIHWSASCNKKFAMPPQSTGK